MGRQVAIVTGARRGLGLAIARRLAADAYTVVLTDIDGEDVDRAARGLRRDGASVVSAPLDVTDPAGVGELVARVIADHDRIDVLVNNAGFSRDAPITEMSDEAFRAVLDVCLYGTFVGCRAVAPYMIRQASGRIVNMASRAYFGSRLQANYSAAKAGIVGLTRALAAELGPHGITVNAIAPGLIDTEAVSEHPRASELLDAAKRLSVVGRVGLPEEVAAAVSYLCSPAAGYHTGDVLHVSGGRLG